MESSTTKERTLRPTRQNTDEAEDKQCNYTLLTQIVEIRAHPAAPQTTKRDGATVPSLDAADPLSGSSGPVYREDLEVAFALFRASKFDPILDTFVLEPASANVSDTFMAGMDRVANRVSHDVKKKGSARQSGQMRILRGFLESDEFGLSGSQSLRLQQQIVHVSITAAAAEQSFDVAVDGFNHTQWYLRPAVVQDALEMIQQHAG